jgi:hypothetical protein
MTTKRYEGPRTVYIDGQEIKEVKSVLMRFEAFQSAVVEIELYAFVKEEPGKLLITTATKEKQ